ncbi:MAG: YncE family protein, partial [Prevotella sp.]
YFSAYFGYVYKLSLDTFQITVCVLVGASPEAIAIANGKLYAALSNYDTRGNGKYLAEVDLNTFKKIKNVEVDLNPYSQMIAVGSKVFFVSNLDYSDNILQMMDATTDKVTEIGHGSSIAYDKLNDDIICISAVYGHPEFNAVYRYDITTGKKTDIKLSQTPGNIGQVSVSPNSGYLYIVNQNYTGPCELWVYDQYGTFKSKFESGMASQRVIFLR